jgi:hypothetical protein
VVVPRTASMKASPEAPVAPRRRMCSFSIVAKYLFFYKPFLGKTGLEEYY